MMRYPFESVATTVVVLGLIGMIWSIAHSNVAHECDKLGAFYVGDQVFECKRKKEHPHGV